MQTEFHHLKTEGQDRTENIQETIFFSKMRRVIIFVELPVHLKKIETSQLPFEKVSLPHSIDKKQTWGFSMAFSRLQSW